MHARTTLRPGIFLSLFLRLVGALVLLTISRLLLYVFNIQIIGSVDFGTLTTLFVAGLRFDLSALLYLNALFILLMAIPLPWVDRKSYRFITNVFYLIPNSLGIFANLADAGYFPFSLRRTTGEILGVLNAGGDVSRLALNYLKDYWYLGLAWLLMTAVLIWLNAWAKYRLGAGSERGWQSFLKKSVIALVILAFTVIGMRGGLQLRPISVIAASRYTVSPVHTQVILNTPFCLITTYNRQAVLVPTFFSEPAEAERYFNPVQYITPNEAGTNINVVIFILESFSSEFSVFLNPDGEAGCTGFTPFLDSLMQSGLAFNAYANGTRSIEAVAAVLSGLPALTQVDLISSQFAGNCIPSIASYLTTKGYHSAFFHGGHNGTMNFDAFAYKTGFRQYFGMKEYPDIKDYDGRWGIYDGPFMQYFLHSLDAMPRPFLGAFFSLSSHHPYSLPDGYVHLFTGGRLPVHKTVEYTDLALRQFFDAAKKSEWYKNTLFVLTADHTTEGCAGTSVDAMQRYRIPLVFFAPGFNLPSSDAKVVQQCDILPSILDVVGYDGAFLSFGQSVFCSDRLNIALAGQEGTYLFRQLENTMVIKTDGSIVNLESQSYQEVQSPTLSKNINASANIGKAIIQQYLYRLNHNKLCQNQ